MVVFIYYRMGVYFCFVSDPIPLPTLKSLYICANGIFCKQTLYAEYLLSFKFCAIPHWKNNIIITFVERKKSSGKKSKL